MAHHKIWESGRNPHKRNDKGKRKPQAVRQAKERLRQFKKRHMGRPQGDLLLYIDFS
jgi:hypothetical protein